MAFFSFGTRDHDIAVMQVPAEVPVASPGLAHVALEIEGGPDELLFTQILAPAEGMAYMRAMRTPTTRSAPLTWS